MRVKLFILLLLPVIAQAQLPNRSRPIIIPQRDSSREMQYQINSKVFNNGVTESINLFNVRNGYWLSIPQDTLMLAKYRGLNHGSIDTILHIRRGNVRMSPKSELTLPWTQVTDKPTLFSGNYNDLTNKPTIPTVNTPTVSNPVRAFNSAFQPSATRNSDVQYSVSISASMSISGGQSGTVYLETSPNNSTWTTQAQISTANSGALAVGLNLTNTETKTIRAFVPAGYWVRLRTAGTGTITYITSQEVLL